MGLSRRTFLGGAAAGVAAAALSPSLAHAEPIPSGRASSSSLREAGYRLKVPELYTSPPKAPAHSPVIVLGSGFGASVAALRLVESGQRVTMLERGSRWPNTAWRSTFTNDALPDGRAFWFRKSFTGVTGLPVYTDSFGGVLDATDYAGITVWRGAAVGGGSVVFTGALVQPEKSLFQHVFGSTVNYDELASTYYPRAMKMLRGSTMPSDVYNSKPFGHSREWDRRVRKAGFEPVPTHSIFNWDVVRQELQGRSRPSAIIGESNYGNSNGAKYDLAQNYLAQAEATGKLTIHYRHVVTDIGMDGGKYWLKVLRIEPGGSVIETMTITCDKLFLGAGSVGTSELLVRARALGTLPNLNEYIGAGWGGNGDAALAQSFAISGGLTQASPCASRISDVSNGMPITLENWYVPGLPVNVGICGSLGMTLTDRRANFSYDRASGTVQLDWPKNGMDDSIAALRATHNKIISAAGGLAGLPGIAPDVNASFTAHPLGGAVLGKATDNYGRVVGYSGLYVVDGAGIPGSTATVNPSLTITALAERAMENIRRNGS